MVFWIGILIGCLFAWSAVKIGFYQMWAILFSIVIAIYLAIFSVKPVSAVTGVSNTLYSDIMAIAGTAAVAFLILYGLLHLLLISQYSISLPKIFDTVGAGILGFLAGTLIWGFLTFLICISPFSQSSFVKAIDFTNQFEQINKDYLSWWCNRVNSFVSSQDSGYTAEKALDDLLGQAQTRFQKDKSDGPEEPAEPNDVQIETSEEEQLGPPPDIDAEETETAEK